MEIFVNSGKKIEIAAQTSTITHKLLPELLQALLWIAIILGFPTEIIIALSSLMKNEIFFRHTYSGEKYIFFNLLSIIWELNVTIVWDKLNCLRITMNFEVIPELLENA